ncbi:hypothetical protein M3661_19765 [Paenibacillus sp. MER 180]|uniref:hypothetical protein n=1 Tax=Paenibacillus sp. MER 180 TaxID=2939570 RepID=UPI00203A618C|nr:hypothetical protein [Paenibacillus sp. MER 180]MCM3292361.1 hypothetical protein [Paenibacillus sp. MER 180]
MSSKKYQNHNVADEVPLHKHVTKGIIEAERYGSGAGLAFLEILIISLALGFSYSSWWLFGGALVGLLVLMQFKKARAALLIVFVAAWVFIAWKIGQIMFNNLGASVVLSAIALIISGALHARAYEEWNEDEYFGVDKPKEKNKKKKNQIMRNSSTKEFPPELQKKWANFAKKEKSEL